jgi:hypothetical protein
MIVVPGLNWDSDGRGTIYLSRRPRSRRVSKMVAERAAVGDGAFATIERHAQGEVEVGASATVRACASWSMALYSVRHRPLTVCAAYDPADQELCDDAANPPPTPPGWAPRQEDPTILR